MSGFSHLPLQKAIYQLLTNDSALMGLVDGIYDRPPQSSAFPYITLGESNCADRSTKTTTGLEQTVMLHVWSREGGRAQVAGIMERMQTLLYDASMTVEGQTLVMIRFQSSSITLEDDGWTYQGLMRFMALLEAN